MYYNSNAREDRVRIFEDTLEVIKDSRYLSESQARSIANQEFIPSGTDIDISAFEPNKEGKIIVSMDRSFKAASKYKQKKVCVLNFASATNPGGGVTKGSSAQEECLCRCSYLYNCLNDESMLNSYYRPHKGQSRLHNDDIIYTPGVVVFKSDTQAPVLMRNSEWFNVDIISCAAPNLRTDGYNRFNSSETSDIEDVDDQDLENIQTKRLTQICKTAISKGCNALILGAFGCGAFQNKPLVVAIASRNVMEKYRYYFDVIEFAVYCTPQDTTNYREFKWAFGAK